MGSTGTFDPVELVYLTWPDVEQYLKRSDIFIVPTGAVEQHGPSCPIGTDLFLATEIARRLSGRTGVMFGPCIAPGDSLSLSAFPGTVALRPTTFIEVLRDYVTSLHRVGFRRFLILGAHWDNHFPAAAAMSELADTFDDLRFLIRDFWEFASVRDIFVEEFDEAGGHADAADASLLLALDESLVKSDQLTAEFPPVRYQVGRSLTRGLLTKSGVIGSDQTRASRAAGERLLGTIVDEYVETIATLRS